MNRILAILATSTVALLCGLTSNVEAQQVSSPFSVVAGTGYGRGGDTIIVGQYTDGTVTNIKAGNGLEVFAGAAYRLNENFAIQGDVGYQSSTGNGTNGELTFKRIPVELLGYYYLTNSWRVGAGARFDEHVKLSGSGVASSVQSNFDSAVGSMLELEYLVAPEFGIKFRAVKENFKPSGYSNTFSGDQAAILVTLYF